MQNVRLSMSALTNLIAAAVLALGYALPHPVLQSIGWFALSGSLTNWLAVHMLFEKVPLCYGSGIIPLRFEEFKTAIRALMIEQFFSRTHIERFFQQGSPVSAETLQGKIDFNRVFDGLVEAIASSSFGGLLGIIGGTQALEGLRPTVVQKLSDIVSELAGSQRPGEDSDLTASLVAQVEAMIDARLAELTPEKVKEIVQQMIAAHLGWLVVWGGVFGGLIGLLSALLP